MTKWQASNDVKVCIKCGNVESEVKMYCDDCGCELIVKNDYIEMDLIDEYGVNNIDLVLESKRSKY